MSGIHSIIPIFLSFVVRNYLSLVKFSHTIFALPFALIGLALGFHAVHFIDWSLAFKVILCMVFARNAAMAFNRWADEKYDSLNPRTAQREIPAGKITSKNAITFVIVNAISFIVATYFINQICFFLSPIALSLILGYSLTKRWTFLCHLVLGIGLSLAPIGAYLAVTGRFDLIPLLFSGVVFYWVAGFDIIYALQDEEFDQSNKLFSIPARFGKVKALTISRCLHFICAMLVIFTAYQMKIHLSSTGFITYVASAFFICLLIYQQLLIKTNDLSIINLAFFTTNGIASIVLGSLVIIDLIW